MEKSRKKIGIMGGTFDPVHFGHLLIAENAAQQYQLDEVWFMPTGYSPHKEQKYITDDEHRCRMIHLAIEDNPGFILSLEEVESERTNYTYQTLEELQKKYPENEFYFILGGDSLKNFETWRYPERVLNATYILAAVRDDMEGDAFWQQVSYLEQKYNAKGIFALRTPNSSISSREIRQRIYNQKTVRYMLPEKVRAYILENGLYRQYELM